MRSTKRGLTAFAVGLAGSAVLGAIAGLIWGAAAPRVLFEEYAAGAAQQVNEETSAYIVGDVWFCCIAVAGGLITGIAGTRLLVRDNGWPAALGLIGGAVAAAFVAMWVGGLIGLSTFNHQLATSSVGTLFNDSLSLNAKTALAFWPLVTSAIIALTAGARRNENENEQMSGMWTEGQADGHAP